MMEIIPDLLWAAVGDARPSAALGLFDLAAVLVALTALFAYLNHRFIRLPPSIGVMALALAFSLALTGVGLFIPSVERTAEGLVQQIDFNKTVLHGMLGFLLFAGALHINLGDLASRKTLIAILATAGVVLTTLIVGLLTWLALTAAGVPARLLYCLMFGALVAPTDPIAVLAMLKEAAAPKPLEVTLAGESLFNDGVAVVVFLGFLQAAVGGQDIDLARLTTAFVQEGLGGALFGFLAGVLFYYLFKSVDRYQVEILLSLALVMGGYTLATALHVSAPIAMVVAGLLIGNHGRAFAMSETTREHLDTFWELIDEILNTVLFVLLGLEVLALKFTGIHLLVGLLLIPILLFARLVSVTLPVGLMRTYTPVEPYTSRLLWWGGLRGGLSVAMALSVPDLVGGERVLEREWMLTATYVIVAFSVLVQGTTVGPLMRRWLRAEVESTAALPTASAGLALREPT
jgi:CPA1 family monovalent cation:H+ antiporter